MTVENAQNIVLLVESDGQNQDEVSIEYFYQSGNASGEYML